MNPPAYFPRRLLTCSLMELCPCRVLVSSATSLDAAWRRSACDPNMARVTTVTLLLALAGSAVADRMLMSAFTVEWPEEVGNGPRGPDPWDPPEGGSKQKVQGTTLSSVLTPNPVLPSLLAILSCVHTHTNKVHVFWGRGEVVGERRGERGGGGGCLRREGHR